MRLLATFLLIAACLNCYATSYSAQQVEQLLNAHAWEDENNEYILLKGDRYFAYQDCHTNFFGWDCAKHYQKGQLVDYGRIDYKPDGFVLSTPLSVTHFQIKALVDDHLQLTGIVSCNGDCDIHESDSQWTPIHETVNAPPSNNIYDAAIYGDSAYIEKFTGDVNQANSTGNTALIYASNSPFYETVDLLLKKGANPNVISQEAGVADGLADLSEGETPLTLAVDTGEKHSVALLLNAGANVNFHAQNIDIGSTALIDAVTNDNLAIVKLLIEHGANLNTMIQGGSNVLELAMTRDAPMRSETASGYTDNLGFVRYLVETAGVQVNSVDGQGQTALAVAINALLPKTVSYLLSQGANPNFQDAKKNTPLMWAMQQKTTSDDDVTLLCQTPEFLNIMSLLKAHGANFSLNNDAGKNTLAVAKMTGCNKAARLIKTYPA